MHGFAQAVLAQKHRGKMHPIVHYSTKLDLVALGFPPCLRAVVAASYAMQVTATIVLENPLILHVPCAVSSVLLKSRSTIFPHEGRRCMN